MKFEHKPKIGIVGMGFVGGAIAKGFSLTADVKIYDKDPKRSAHSFEDICGSEFIFLCLPTPMERVEGGKADLTIIYSVCQQFVDCGTEGILIIKSTVPIGTTLGLQERYGLKIVHNPEFLTARNANIDFITPARTILGGTKELTSRVAELFTDRFPGTNIFEMTSNESEAVKYIANVFFAVKVIYFNEVLLGLKEAYKLDWEKVMGGVLTDGRIGISHCDVPGHDGNYGFSGACVLPSARIKVNNDVITMQALYKLWSSGNKDIITESANADLTNLESKSIKDVTIREINEELYEFYTENGVFTCTGDHYMPVKRNEKNVLVQAKEIKDTDLLFSK